MTQIRVKATRKDHEGITTFDVDLLLPQSKVISYVKKLIAIHKRGKKYWYGELVVNFEKV